MTTVSNPKGIICKLNCELVTEVPSGFQIPKGLHVNQQLHWVFDFALQVSNPKGITCKYVFYDCEGAGVTCFKSQRDYM